MDQNKITHPIEFNHSRFRIVTITVLSWWKCLIIMTIIIIIIIIIITIIIIQ